MSRRLAALIAPLALLFGAGVASAQHHGGGHGGGGHGGGGHPGGHGGGVYHGGGAYHGGYYHGGHSHNTFALGIGIGLGGYGYGGYGGYAYPSYGYPVYGGYSYYSYPSYSYAVPVAPPVIVNPSTSYYQSPEASAPTRLPAATVAEPASGMLTVIVPAGAQVWFDGKETGKAEGNRIFSTPALEPGKSTVLSLKVDIDGSTSQMRIPLKAGDKMTLDMRK